MNDETNIANQSPNGPRNGRIIAAILSGFMLLALTVGGLGFYLFSRQADRAVDHAESVVGQRYAIDLGNSSNRESVVISPVDRIDDDKNTLSSANHNRKLDAKASRALEIVASSKSVRQPENGNYYFPNFAFDNASATAWCEGASGSGLGEWLQFNFARETELKQIKIQPGYFKSLEDWRKNNRVAKILVESSDGSTREFALVDNMESQTLDVGRMRTSYVKITIEDFFASDSKAKDTCVSEVSFVTES